MKTPSQYLRADKIKPESEYAAQNGTCKIITATAADFARLDAEIAAKVRPVTIAGGRKKEKKPGYPHEIAWMKRWG